MSGLITRAPRFLRGCHGHPVFSRGSKGCRGSTPKHSEDSKDIVKGEIPAKVPLA